MDDFKETPKPPLLLPEPDQPAAPVQERTLPTPVVPEDLVEVTEIEPRDEPVEEIEQLPRERRPQGSPPVRMGGAITAKIATMVIMGRTVRVRLWRTGAAAISARPKTPNARSSSIVRRRKPASRFSKITSSSSS